MELWDRRIHLNKAVNGSTVEGGHSCVYFSAQSPLVHDSSLKKSKHQHSVQLVTYACARAYSLNWLCAQTGLSV